MYLKCIDCWSRFLSFLLYVFWFNPRELLYRALLKGRDKGFCSFPWKTHPTPVTGAKSVSFPGAWWQHFIGGGGGSFLGCSFKNQHQTQHLVVGPPWWPPAAATFVPAPGAHPSLSSWLIRLCGFILLCFESTRTFRYFCYCFKFSVFALEERIKIIV